MPGPHELAAHVERKELPSAEPRVDASAIRDGTGRREIVLVVYFVEPSFGWNFVFPSLAAIDAVQRRDKERHFFIGRCRGPAKCTFAGIGWIPALYERGMIAGASRASTDL